MLNYAVIGHPIGHSMSPYVQSYLFSISGVKASYTTIDIAPESLGAELELQLSKLNGFNITIPHKTSIIPLLDKISEEAALYGAVNCVCNSNGSLIGHNTDAYGFKQALKMSDISLSGKVLLLGSGGAARTVAYEAALAGCELTVAARSLNGQRLANEIAEKIGKMVNVISFDQIKGGYDLVVNATPVGMHPNVNAAPISIKQLDGCKALFDAVYNPRRTLLVKYAQQLGMAVAEGTAMLVMQAVKAQQIWYGASFTEQQLQQVIDGVNAEIERAFGGIHNE